MSIVGGDVKEVTYSHPEIGSGSIFVKSDEDSELDLGGYKSVDEEKSIDSGGNMIDIMTLSRWSATFVVAGDLMVRKELEKLSSLMRSTVPAVWTITHVSGAIYRGIGKPVGDLKQVLKASTIQLKVAGGGEASSV